MRKRGQRGYKRAPKTTVASPFRNVMGDQHKGRGRRSGSKRRY